MIEITTFLVGVGVGGLVAGLMFLRSVQEADDLVMDAKKVSDDAKEHLARSQAVLEEIQRLENQ